MKHSLFKIRKSNPNRGDYFVKPGRESSDNER